MHLDSNTPSRAVHGALGLVYLMVPPGCSCRRAKLVQVAVQCSAVHLSRVLLCMNSLLWSRILFMEDSWNAGEDEGEIVKAVEAIAELALLGAGDIDKLFPESLDEAYAAYGADEMEWRVVL